MSTTLTWILRYIWMIATATTASARVIRGQLYPSDLRQSDSSPQYRQRESESWFSNPWHDTNTEEQKQDESVNLEHPVKEVTPDPAIPSKCVDNPYLPECGRLLSSSLGYHLTWAEDDGSLEWYGDGMKSVRQSNIIAPSPTSLATRRPAHPSVSYITDFPWVEGSATASPTKDMCYGKKAQRNKKFCHSEMPSISLEPSLVPTSLPGGSTSSASTCDSFRLKLHWQDGYLWQEQPIEREWCMACEDGECQQGEDLHIHECNGELVSAYFNFVPLNQDSHSGAGDGDDTDRRLVLIQVVNTDLCMERFQQQVALEPCDSTNVYQQWGAPAAGPDCEFGNTFAFEISQPIDGEDYCMTTHHHPKHGEIVELFRCKVVRKDETSLWNFF